MNAPFAAGDEVEYLGLAPGYIGRKGIVERVIPVTARPAHDLYDVRVDFNQYGLPPLEARSGVFTLVKPASTDYAKPYKGKITDWRKFECSGGLGFFIVGAFQEHPEIEKGRTTNTSYVVKWTETHSGVEIETRNSRYFLVNTAVDPKSVTIQKWINDHQAPITDDAYATAQAIIAQYQREHESRVTTLLRKIYPKRADMERYIATLDRAQDIRQACGFMTMFSHGNSVACGWHDGVKRDDATLLALMHSEISEALEGLRKDKMDDHLPERKSVEVELADLLHRVFDFAGKHDLDLGNAYIEKGFYNLRREDHKKEVRAAEGGKKF